MDGEIKIIGAEGLDEPKVLPEVIPGSSGIPRMRQEHHRVLEMALDGMSNSEIARELGRSPVTIGMLVNQPMFQNALAERRAERNKVVDKTVAQKRAEALEILDGSVVVAAHTQVQLLASSDENVKQRAVNAIFDRVYGKSMERTMNVNLNAQVPESKLDQLAGVLAELD